jgi:hypothetical protein
MYWDNKKEWHGVSNHNMIYSKDCALLMNASKHGSCLPIKMKEPELGVCMRY